MGGIRLQRRRFLAAAGGVALLAGLAPMGRVWSAPRFAGDPFTLGIAAGDPWPDGFVIWTRLAPRPLQEHGGMPMLAVPVRWQVAEDERFTRIVRSGEALARPELAHSVHVEVAGLRPARPYWYRFQVEGSQARPVGTARTAPAAQAMPARVRMAVVGCQAYHHGWFDAYAHLANEPDLDVVFHYGDYIYEGGSYQGSSAQGRGKYVIVDARDRPVQRHHVGGELYSLDDYRRRYAQYKGDPMLQAAHARVAFVASFDDHEVDNDYASVFDQDGTPPEIFALRRHAAMQAWYEHMPVRRAQLPRLDGLSMYRRLDYGRLLRMHVLDTRSHRSDQPCVRPGQPHCRGGDWREGTLLGQAQERWLEQGLEHDARWNLIAQQVLVMPLKAIKLDGETVPPLADKWDGYPATRERLVRTIRQKALTNVVIASGDAHMHAVGSVPLRDDEPDGPAVATEFLATSITSNGDGALDSPSVKRFLDADNPHLALANNLRGYQTFDISANEWRTDVKVMDRVQKPGGRLSVHASFAMTPDRPLLHRV